mgnify:FL=1
MSLLTIQEDPSKVEGEDLQEVQPHEGSGIQHEELLDCYDMVIDKITMVGSIQETWIIKQLFRDLFGKLGILLLQSMGKATAQDSMHNEELKTCMHVSHSESC